MRSPVGHTTPASTFIPRSCTYWPLVPNMRTWEVDRPAATIGFRLSTATRAWRADAAVRAALLRMTTAARMARAMMATALRPPAAICMMLLLDMPLVVVREGVVVSAPVLVVAVAGAALGVGEDVEGWLLVSGSLLLWSLAPAPSMPWASTMGSVGAGVVLWDGVALGVGVGEGVGVGDEVVNASASAPTTPSSQEVEEESVNKEEEAEPSSATSPASYTMEGRGVEDGVGVGVLAVPTCDGVADGVFLLAFFNALKRCVGGSVLVDTPTLGTSAGPTEASVVEDAAGPPAMTATQDTAAAAEDRLDN